MREPDTRQRLGEAGRENVVKLFDYRTVAKRFVELMTTRLGLT
jgi:glycosyltransferase involved in cell wall biosynthesis